MDFEYSHDRQDLPDKVRCDCDALILSMSFRITGSSGIEVRTEMKLRASLYQTESYKAICYAASNEDKPREKDNSASLVIYYADKGENIWNIARNYCTCVEAIMNENELSDEILDSRAMLMIPV